MFVFKFKKTLWKVKPFCFSVKQFWVVPNEMARETEAALQGQYCIKDAGIGGHDTL